MGEEIGGVAGGMARRTEAEEGADVEGSLVPASRLLDAVLNDLYDFGEALVDGSKKRKRKKTHSHENVARTASNKLSEDSSVDPEFGALGPSKRKKPPSFFDSLKEELASDCINRKKSALECNSSNAVCLKSDQQGNMAEVEVVTFHGRPKKKKDQWDNSEVNDSKVNTVVQGKRASSHEFNLEKARLEVHQFGISGFEKKEQRVLEQERAIMLGAKPPKKQYLNYKILQQQVKEKKAAKKEENITENKSNSLKRRKKKGHEDRKSRKKTKQSILPTGQVGTFKNGTLILCSSDIKKIKSSKVVK